MNKGITTNRKVAFMVHETMILELESHKASGASGCPMKMVNVSDEIALKFCAHGCSVDCLSFLIEYLNKKSKRTFFQGG